jgi:uncharacterized protein
MKASPLLLALLAMISLSNVIAGVIGCVSRPSPKPEASSKATNVQKLASGSNYLPEERRTLLRLARAALEQAVRQGKHMSPPADVQAPLREHKGCFVTLTKQGKLRGCIGNINPDMPLAEAVTTNAYRAALNDSRFAPVTSEELSAIEIEVSVLSVPQPLPFASPADLLQKLRPHVDGVVLKVGSRRATFLPQVWEKLPMPTDFLDHLAAKAGLSSGAWRDSGTEIMIYHVDAFTESEPDAG